LRGSAASHLDEGQEVKVMTDLSGWFASVLDAGAVGTPRGCSLYAFTEDGLVKVADGPDLRSLGVLPADRLALGPVTQGGLVVWRLAESRRFVCADDAGGVEVWSVDHNGRQQVDLVGDDHDAAALLWRLMDPVATRPRAREVLARLLLWAWIQHPVSARHAGVTVAFASLHLAPGVEAFSAGQLRRLGRLVGVAVNDLVSPDDVCRLAPQLGHPDLDWTDYVDDNDVEAQLDFLHACVPTRWALSAELRTMGRPDLAVMVMAAPAA
jgi:hypothetical protein